MAKQRHLKNAPITEAIIDLRTKLPSIFNAKEFLSLKESFRDRFPKIQERRFVKSELKLKTGKIPSTITDEGIHGYFFKPEDEKKVVQFRIDGFTFNKLKPYTYWDEFVNEAKELWKWYVDKSHPDSITRIAVRYINHIDFPQPIIDFSKYLTAPPNMPEDLPGEISGFLSRVVVYNSEIDVSTNITQALDKSVKPNHVTIILDIDAFRLGEFNSDSEEIWQIFEKLHSIKNQIFFNSITEETVRLFE